MAEAHITWTCLDCGAELEHGWQLVCAECWESKYADKIQRHVAVDWDKEVTERDRRKAK